MADMDRGVCVVVLYRLVVFVVVCVVFFFFKQKTAYEISACLVGSEIVYKRQPHLYNA